MHNNLYLSRSAKLRYASAALLYFAQGIPQGLLAIAMPAWLASQGASASEIASYLAVIVLPWAFKLITGPVMDRYGFAPMGLRRPWVLGAQLGLALSLLSLGLVHDPISQLGLLTLIGVITNSFAATQDVAVDGMAIDLVPKAQQGRINAFMSSGKAIGWAVTSAVSGVLLVNYGTGVTAVVAALVAGLVFILFLMVREREGERLLPWGEGRAAGQDSTIPNFRSLGAGLKLALWTGTSAVVLTIMFIDGLVVGYGQALMPIAAVNLFEFSTESWSQLVAVMGLAGALVALAFGPVIDRFGAQRMLALTIALVGAHALLLANTQQLWSNEPYVQVMLSLWVLMNPITMVCVIALAMSICSAGVSATQFAVYMSMANLGVAGGAKLFGLMSAEAHASFAERYLLLGALLGLMLLVVLVFRKQDPAECRVPECGQ